ncbi:MAG: hypothetical protein OK454_01565, partial [Thaumarchaeota archaeon]|nr:hypothetical protein [Nitrososphaerota archaeon]
MIAADADAKRVRGEKLPQPPVPSQGPRKRYDTGPSIHRPLAAVESLDEAGTMKSESQVPQQPFTGRFQVPIPIAQAPGPPQQTQAVPVPPPASQTVTQAMSPNARPLRAPPVAPFGYPE